MEVFDGIRQSVMNDRSQFYKDLTMQFFGYNREGAKISEGVRENFWLQGMQGGIKGQYDCIKAFSATDFNEDLNKIDIPTLVMHGDDDQIVPIANSGLLSAKLVKGAQLNVYKGLAHGMAITHHEQINPDLLSFIRS